MSELKEVSVSGQIDGQKLFHGLSASAQGMKTAWCRSSGIKITARCPSGVANTARRQQLTQMLNKYLAEQYPLKANQDQTRMDTMVSWNGLIDKMVTFTVKVKLSQEEKEKILSKIKRLILKPEK